MTRTLSEMRSIVSVLLLGAVSWSATPAPAQDPLDTLIEGLESELVLTQTKRAESDLRMLSTTVMSYLVDYEGRVPEAASAEELVALLREEYGNQSLTAVDPWGQSYHYVAWNEGEEAWAPSHVVLVSAGADGELALVDLRAYAAPPETLPEAALTRDLVWVDGTRISRSVVDDWQELEEKKRAERAARPRPIPTGPPARLEVLPDGSYRLDGRPIADRYSLLDETRTAPELSGDRRVLVVLPVGADPTLLVNPLQTFRQAQHWYDPPRWADLRLEVPKANDEGVWDIPGDVAIVVADGSGIRVASDEETPGPVPDTEDVMSFSYGVMHERPETEFLVLFAPGSAEVYEAKLIGALDRGGIRSAYWVTEDGGRVFQFD